MSGVRRLAIVAGYLCLCVALAVVVAGVPNFDEPRLEVRSSPGVSVTTTTVPAVVQPPRGQEPTATTTSTVPARDPAQVKVRFYNGSRTGGAAVIVGQRLEVLGYEVLEPGPSPADPYPATAVWFAEGWAAEGAKVAQDLGLAPEAARAMPAAPPLPRIGDAVVVVVVADDVVSRA